MLAILQTQGNGNGPSPPWREKINSLACRGVRGRLRSAVSVARQAQWQASGCEARSAGHALRRRGDWLVTASKLWPREQLSQNLPRGSSPTMNPTFFSKECVDKLSLFTSHFIFLYRSAPCPPPPGEPKRVRERERTLSQGMTVLASSPQPARSLALPYSPTRSYIHVLAFYHLHFSPA